MAEPEVKKSSDDVSSCWFCCTIAVCFSFSVPASIGSMILFVLSSGDDYYGDYSGFRTGAILLLTFFFIAIVIGTVFSILQCIRTSKPNRGVVHSSNPMPYIVQPGNNNAQVMVNGIPAYNTTVVSQPHRHQQPTSPLYTPPGPITSNRNYSGLYADTLPPTPKASATREADGYLVPRPEAVGYLEVFPTAPAGCEENVYSEAEIDSDNYLPPHDSDGNEIGTYDYIR